MRGKVINVNMINGFCTLCVLSLAASRAGAVVLSFDSLPGMPNTPGGAIPGASQLSAQFVSDGVLFSSSAPFAAVVSIGVNHATSGANAIGGSVAPAT